MICLRCVMHCVILPCGRHGQIESAGKDGHDLLPEDESYTVARRHVMDPKAKPTGRAEVVKEYDDLAPCPDPASKAK